MNLLRLALLDSASTPAQQTEIKNILVTALLCLGEHWKLVETTEKPNLLCVWVATSADLIKLQEAEKRHPSDRLLLISALPTQSQAQWQLFFSKQNAYPRITSLLNLLSQVQENFFPHQPTATAQATFDPQLYFIGVLQTALADGVAKQCSIPGQPALYLLPKENTVYINGNLEKVISLLLTPVAQISVQNISVDHLLEQVNYAKFSARLGHYASFLEEDLFHDANAPKYTRYAFIEVIWFATFIASQGRLLLGACADERLFLPEIPDFISENYPELLTSFAQLDRLILTALLNREHELSHYMWINFYNACLMLPTVERGTKVIEKPKYAFVDLELTLQEHVTKLSDNTIVIVAGSQLNAGKSTFCNTLGDSLQLAPVSSLKVEYGEIHYGDHASVLFYEIPWQPKLDASTKALCSNAWGLVVLINNIGAAPFAELDYYLKVYKAYFNAAHLVIGVTHTDVAVKPALADYVSYLENLNYAYPVLAIDPRELSDSVAVMIALLKQPR